VTHQALMELYTNASIDMDVIDVLYRNLPLADFM